MEYYCDNCKYHSKQLCNFKRHLESQQHIKKSLNINDNLTNSTNPSNSTNVNNANNPINIVNTVDTVNINHTDSANIRVDKYEHYKKKLFCCETCENVYITKRSLLRHSKNCEIENNKIILEAKIDKLKNTLETERNNHKEQLNKVLDIARDSSKTANVSMNILKYAKLHLNNVEPLKELNSDDVLDVIKYKNPKGIETKNETYVKTAIHKFNHGIFANFVGDMIISYYKPKTKNEANVIATDTSRLCFIIMQKVKKDKIEQNEWINDKSGKKFIELVLKPIINAVKETLVEFIEFKKTKELNENSLCLMGKCVELKRDIEVEKFTKPILRYVAPSFHFDTLKLLDGETWEDTYENTNNEKTTENNQCEKIIKIIAKKKK